ncbi:hypothetical protein NL676_017696 [Syzygium grande]|nr:hypothetical protein NL676_017696 [Syzygium grande]
MKRSPGIGEGRGAPPPPQQPPPPMMMQRRREEGRKEGHERRWCVAEEEIEDEIAMGGRDLEEARAQSFNM